MEDLTAIPGWLGGAVLSVIIAALTYAAKTVNGWIAEQVARRNARKARLQELQALLRTGRAIFLRQHELVRRLVEEMMLDVDLSNQAGWEDMLSAAYDSFTPEQRATHAMIRAMKRAPKSLNAIVGP